MEAIYARISDDREGTEHGVDRQVEDCQALASAPVPDDLIFKDNDVSASTTSTKARPRYDALMAAIEAGKVTTVYAYSNSRLTRRLREYLDLIELHKKYGVQFRTVVSGSDDLSTADGRMVAIIKAQVDAAEAERVGERVARQKRQRAADGLPQGGRYPTYGFTKDFMVVPDQAAKLTEAFERRSRGESVTSIAGVVGIGHGTLSRILTNPIYVGLRAYKGEVVGEMHEEFPRLIQRHVWDAVQAQTATPTPGHNTRKHLLSGIARCGKCGGKMKGTGKKDRAARYRCAASYGGCGTVSIRMDWIDWPVQSSVLSREMAGKTVPVVQAPETGAEDAATIRSELAEVQAAVSSGALSMATALPMLTGLEARLQAAETSARRVAVAEVEDTSWVFGDVADALNDTLGAQRALLVKHLAAVVIEEAPTQGRNRFDGERVSLHWKDGEVETLFDWGVDFNISAEIAE